MKINLFPNDLSIEQLNIICAGLGEFIRKIERLPKDHTSDDAIDIAIRLRENFRELKFKIEIFGRY